MTSVVIDDILPRSQLQQLLVKLSLIVTGRWTRLQMLWFMQELPATV